ncbi:MAG TPA: ATP-binding protein [Vicinamibacteria bacterium]|nr:ATP-binding protein [Vicinamibacteria bacterium]
MTGKSGATDPSFESPRPLGSLPASGLVAVAYYLACQVGFDLRFPPATTSVLWPPNSILTAAFLLTPPGRWWITLAVVFPAHVLVELQAGLALPLVLSLFLTNCSEAVLAAAIIRTMIEAPIRFDTLRKTIVLVAGAVVIAPFVTGFADAAAVAYLRAEPYWTVWGRRFPSNALAGLTVVPAVVGFVGGAWNWLRTASARRKTEAALLAGALLVVSQMVFASAEERSWPLPGAPYTSLSFLLPLLLWSAVRFGIAGASLSLFATVALASWSATHGLHPLSQLPPLEGTLAMQIFLIVVGIPLTFLAALADERRAVERALRERLAFEQMLSDMSSAFVNRPSHQLDAAVESALGRLGAALRAERVLLYAYPKETQETGVGWSWSAEGVERSPGALPPEHGQLGGSWVPLVVNDKLLGSLGVWISRGALPPVEDLSQRLQLVAAVLANALARENAEGEARRSRDELAHTLRVSTMGVLGTSLAHELNQPLHAIMMNAETALTRLEEGFHEPEELRAILSDIVSDDLRASTVISRIRPLLRKGDSEQVSLDVNDLVREVISLLDIDARAREVVLKLRLNGASAVVRGDRVQLQQVLLNLVLNGIEAMASTPRRDRRILVETSVVGDRAEVRVEDNGPGIPPGREEQVFEPFYTTKPAGLGMGLSIASSLVQAHGGTLRASNGGSSGAVFVFDLPLASGSPDFGPVEIQR